MTRNTPLIRPTDDEAIAMAKGLINNAEFGALGFLDPETNTPVVSRIAIGTLADGTPMSLISDLSNHTKALRENPVCALLLGEPGAKGDPLTHPRISLQCRVEFLARDLDNHAEIRAHYLASHPKSKLYIDFADFSFVRFEIIKAAMNGGFGKAYEFSVSDLI